MRTVGHAWLVLGLLGGLVSCSGAGLGGTDVGPARPDHGAVVDAGPDAAGDGASVADPGPEPDAGPRPDGAARDRDAHPGADGVAPDVLAAPDAAADTAADVPGPPDAASDGAADAPPRPDAGGPPPADVPGAPDTAGSPDTTALDPAACLAHTADERACKDCCDCLPGGCEVYTPCRNACIDHDFSGNVDLYALEIPSVLGPTGDYSVCTGLATERECKACCECSGAFLCGDYRFCRTACAATSGYPPLTLAEIGTPQLVAGGFAFTEGPAWDAARGVLLFSDIDADTIYELTLPDTVAVYRTPSHRANGLAFDPAGRLLAAEHETRRVTRTEADGTVAVVAEAWQGVRLNSPNDLAVRGDGTLWFTDPTYGLGHRPSDLGFTGLFRLAPDGTLALEAELADAPNGLGLAPDARRLYVTRTLADEVLAYSVTGDGRLKDPVPFASVAGPDGLAVDLAGNVYVAGLDGGAPALVVLRADGTRVGALPLAEAPTNCAFGAPDGRTLFVTARTTLWRLAVPIPGF